MKVKNDVKDAIAADTVNMNKGGNPLFMPGISKIYEQAAISLTSSR
jgi:alanine-alpha-ketoisovalerate/valine-pyruvate aminotransferase